MGVLLQEMSTKQINPRVLKEDKLYGVRKLLDHQKLKTFLLLTSRIYPNLVKFFANLTIEGSILRSQVKGFDLKITLEIWEEIYRLYE